MATSASVPFIVQYTVFPCLSAGSQMRTWSQMGAGSKVIVFQISAQ